MNFNILTLGCKVNQYESQAMREDMLNHGYTLSDDKDKADITIVNSCTVTSVSDAKNRKLINKIRRANPDGIIILTGCMPQAFPEETANFKNCDIVLGNAKRAVLIPTLENYLKNKHILVQISEHNGKNEVYENLHITSFGEHTRAFIKIEDGCNRFCSYCIIPYARGRVRSKSLTDLKTEVQRVAAGGYKEVVLVGINLAFYGKEYNLRLADAVEECSKINGIERIRLSSIEPEMILDKDLERLSKIEKLCPQFHLSLQSGCARTLKAMNRRYNPDEYYSLTRKILEYFPNASFTTDIMVGFPEETEQDFEESLAFAEKVGFAKIHVFQYSPRKGTPAAKMKQVPKDIKKGKFCGISSGSCTRLHAYKSPERKSRKKLAKLYILC